MNDKSTTIARPVKKKLRRDMADKVALAVRAYENQIRGISTIMASVVEQEKLRRDMADKVALAARTYQYQIRYVSAIIANVVEEKKLIRDMATRVARAAEVHQYCQKQVSLAFPNIIRGRSSIDSFSPLVSGRPYAPSPVPPTAVTDEVYEEFSPEIIPMPRPEPAPSKSTSKRKNKRISIGHGHSNCWKELRDFIEMALGLPHDEFNCVPTAGLTTTERLQQMTDQADMAFLIMTAENQYVDGTWHARENVVHEVGLFQGVLGFKKAIILLEEGCHEFSNIHGLVQIRFPKGNIKAAFEEIRQVLEREGIIS